MSLRAIISQESEAVAIVSRNLRHTQICRLLRVWGAYQTQESGVRPEACACHAHCGLTSRTLSSLCITIDDDLQNGHVCMKSCKNVVFSFCRLQGRCAAVLFYGHQLAVLPAVGSDAPDLGDDDLFSGGGTGGGGDGNGGVGAGVAAAVANSYVVDLSAQGIREV